MCIILLLSSFLFLWSQSLYTMDEKQPKKPPHQQQFFFSAPPQSKQKKSVQPKSKKEEIITLHYKPNKHKQPKQQHPHPIPPTEIDIKKHEIDKGKQEELPPKPQELKPSFVPATINREKRREEEPSPRHNFLSQESRTKKRIFALPLTRKKNTDPNTSSKSSSREQSPKKLSQKSPYPSPHTSHPSSREQSPRKSLFRDSASKASPKQKQMDDDDYLTKAVRKGKREIINTFLNNNDNDPNQQSIGPKNTLLHLAVLYDKKNPGKNIAMLFLTNSRVNSLIKNTYKCAPYQCIAKEEIQNHNELYNALILRATLDHIVNAMLMTDPKMIENSTNEETALEKLGDSQDIVLEKLRTLIERVKNIIPHYANEEFIFALIQSRIKYNLPTIAMLIRNREINPNTQDDWGNTCLHHAVYLRDKDILIAYLQNPIVSSLIKNSEKLFAHQLISSTDTQYSELRLLLFARNSLDHWIKELFPYFLYAYPTANCIAKLDDPTFQEIIKKIKDKSEQIKKAQKDDDEETDDRELPEITVYPDYATEKFLLDRFNAYKKNEKITDQKTSTSDKSPVEERKQKANPERLSTQRNYDILNEILIELDSSSHTEAPNKT